MLVGYERAEVQLLNLLDAESISPPHRRMGEAVGTAASPAAASGSHCALPGSRKFQLGLQV